MSEANPELAAYVRDAIAREIEPLFKNTRGNAMTIEAIRKRVQYEVDKRGDPLDAVVWIDEDDAGIVHVGFRERPVIIVTFTIGGPGRTWHDTPRTSLRVSNDGILAWQITNAPLYIPGGFHNSLDWYLEYGGMQSEGARTFEDAIAQADKLMEECGKYATWDEATADALRKAWA